MFRTDYDRETMPFTIEGEHTQVLGEGAVTGRIAVARTPLDIVTNRLFDEAGVIPVLLDEHFVSDEDHGEFGEVLLKLKSGLWAGFVTFGSSEMIEYRRMNKKEPSHFMIFLRELARQGDFIAVVDNDEGNKLATNKTFLRSEVGIFHGMNSVLTAQSPTSATIEFAIDL